MADDETKIETGNESEESVESVDEELTDLKKEMAERIVDKMGEKYSDFLLYFGKGWVTDYLVDEGGEDIFNDMLIEKLGVNMLSGYGDQLKNLRDQIKKAETKEAIADLETRIINDLENGSDTGNSGGQSTQYAVTGAGVAAAGTSVAASSESSSSDIEVSVDSAPIGEAKDVPLKKRMEWLFPEGVPQTEKEMKKYIEKIKVPIRTPKGKEKKLKLYVHKKLANEYKAIFQEMYDKGIPVNPDSTACFNRRKMRKGKKMSHHSYGTALDVNWDVNGGVYGPTVKDSPYYNDQATVDIWKKHGFYWGGDWSSKSNDPMHFTYMNG